MGKWYLETNLWEYSQSFSGSSRSIHQKPFPKVFLSLIFGAAAVVVVVAAAAVVVVVAAAAVVGGGFWKRTGATDPVLE